MILWKFVCFLEKIGFTIFFLANEVIFIEKTNFNS